MPTFSSLKEMEKYIQDEINKSLKNDVAPVVKEVMSAEVQNTVYSVYEPKRYERRYDNYGLGDTRNMEFPKVENGKLEVSNNTPFKGKNYSGKSLTEVVVTGEGYTYDYPYEYNQPRDFIEATREDLIQTQAHTKALVNGLKKSGIKFT